MASTVLDSALFRDSFGTPAMRAIFEDAALLARYTEVEMALARAQGRLGVIPAQAAKDIAAQCDAAKLDLARLKKETEVVGYPILPLVRQLAAQCGEAGKFLHWGATTQDIMDTAMILQIKEALAIIEERLAGLARVLSEILLASASLSSFCGVSHPRHSLAFLITVTLRGLPSAPYLSFSSRPHC